MSLPNVQLTIRDPGLGIIKASSGRVQVKAGPTQKGTAATVLTAGSVAAAREAIGSGPVLEAAAQVLSVAGGPVYLLPVTVASLGTVTGSFTLTGAGTGTVTGSKGPEQIVKVKIIGGGTLTTATFQVAVGSGAYGATVTTGAGPYTYQVPEQQFTNVIFTAGTYVANDVFTINLDGTVTRVGSGTATLLDTSTHSPVDTYDIEVQILTGGALGVGAFRYSLDGGNSFSGSIGIPSAGKYVIPSTGVVLTFAGTFTAEDVYNGVTTGPGIINADLTTALVALRADPLTWGFVHVVATPSSAANAATLAGVVGVQTAAAEAEFRYVFALVECPSSESDATIRTAFASYEDARIEVCAGDVDLVSALTGRVQRRNVSWAYAARLSAIKLSSHPGQAAPDNNGGALKNVLSLYRDETATPGLDEARFVTARSFIGETGYYITRGKMMASTSSDYQQVMARRVMDRAMQVAKSAFFIYVNRDLRMDPATGRIDERDAQGIEANVESALEAALISEDEASSVAVVVSRDDNLLSSAVLHAEVEVVPKGYSETIAVGIGLKNPALQAAAAA
jgi:hypothetical protein